MGMGFWQVRIWLPIPVPVPKPVQNPWVYLYPCRTLMATIINLLEATPVNVCKEATFLDNVCADVNQDAPTMCNIQSHLQYSEDPCYHTAINQQFAMIFTSPCGQHCHPHPWFGRRNLSLILPKIPK
jgi:hypothetical protein